jgi:hypothetical protein
MVDRCGLQPESDDADTIEAPAPIAGSNHKTGFAPFGQTIYHRSFSK